MGKWKAFNKAVPQHVHEYPAHADFTVVDGAGNPVWATPGEGSIWECSCGSRWVVVVLGRHRDPFVNQDVTWELTGVRYGLKQIRVVP